VAPPITRPTGPDGRNRCVGIAAASPRIRFGVLGGGANGDRDRQGLAVESGINALCPVCRPAHLSIEVNSREEPGLMDHGPCRLRLMLLRRHPGCRSPMRGNVPRAPIMRRASIPSTSYSTLRYGLTSHGHGGPAAGALP